ncbi:MAG: TetR/AcrR family transcriptional regulator [Actinomycetota bacterium]
MAVETKNEILDAADLLFGRLGFEGATTREIAEASGANKALIHYHFGGKEGLLDGVLDRYYARLTSALVAALHGEGDVRERMHRLVDAYIDFLGENPNFFRIVQREAAGGPRMDRIVARMGSILGLGLPAIREAFPVTASGPLAAEHLAVSFYGAIITYFSYAKVLEGLLGQDPLSERSILERKRHIRWMLDTTLDALEREGVDRQEGA